MSQIYHNQYIKTLLIAACCFVLSYGARAQINAPIFQCVKGDTLFWQPDPNPCGAFNSYQIFYSNNLAGPYSLLATITDPLQLFYVHLGGGPIRYYYLQTDLNCPGYVQLQSDTLDNFPPPKTPIEWVTCTPGGIEINWNPNASVAVIGYIVYKSTSSGTIPIDTVFGNGSNYYLDQNSNGDSLNYYYVLSLDACGNTSQFDVPHHNILGEIQAATCLRSHHLEWNLYDSWPEGIAKHEIYLSINNAPEQLIGTLGPNQTSYDNPGLNKGDNYCYRIAAYRNNSSIASFSNPICDSPVIVQSMKDLYLTNVSALPGDQLEVTWQWDATAELSGYELIHNNQAFENFQAPFSGALMMFNQTLSDLNASAPAQIYVVKTLDLCDTVVLSNTIQNAVLGGVSQTNGNLLTWTPFVISTGTVLSYELYNDAGSLLATLPTDSLSYFDAVPAGSTLKSCYYLRTNFEHEMGPLPDQNFSSLSNLFCVEPQAGIYFPNAFTPQGENPVFKPVLTFQNVIQSYSLQVFDRWGGLVYETSTPGSGWDGMHDSNIMPAGMYIYFARIQQTNGRTVEKTGNVLLIK